MPNPVATRSLAAAIASALVLGLGVAGCGGGSAGSIAPPDTGRLSVAITDGPVDAALEVVVAFTGVELQRANGELVTRDFAKRNVDLLKLQNGAKIDLLDNVEIPAGTYQWLRLKVLATQNAQGESYIRLSDGTQFPLWIPSGAESGLKLVRPFTVAQGGTTNLLIDFDLRKSVTAPGGRDPNYLMRPALRMMDQLQVGKITAAVNLQALATATATPLANCRAGLYLYPSTVTAPDDMDGSATDGADPIVYLPLVNDGTNTTATVTIPFVEVGSYKLAATCNYDKDGAAVDDYDAAATAGQPKYQTMKWSALVPATVAANATAQVTIP